MKTPKDLKWNDVFKYLRQEYMRRYNWKITLRRTDGVVYINKMPYEEMRFLWMHKIMLSEREEFFNMIFANVFGDQNDITK